MHSTTNITRVIRALCALFRPARRAFDIVQLQGDTLAYILTSLHTYGSTVQDNIVQHVACSTMCMKQRPKGVVFSFPFFQEAAHLCTSREAAIARQRGNIKEDIPIHGIPMFIGNDLLNGSHHISHMVCSFGL